MKNRIIYKALLILILIISNKAIAQQTTFSNAKIEILAKQFLEKTIN